jgi:hypothetical protein
VVIATDYIGSCKSNYHTITATTPNGIHAQLNRRRFSLSSLGVVLCGLLDRRRSSTIPVACKRCIRRSFTEWCPLIYPATCPSIAKTCLWHANSCHSQFSPNYKLAMKILYTKNSTTTTCKRTLKYVIRYDTNCKPVLIEHDFIDRWRATHLTKAYVCRYS